MPDTDRQSAQEMAERMRGMVAERPVARYENTDITVTISLGIAGWNPNNPIEINVLLDRADKALYQSKESGRNRVAVWVEGNS